MEIELCDLYNAERKVVKQVPRTDDIPDGYFMLYAVVCIFSSDNRVLIQRRDENAHAFPGLWTFSCGGGVRAGEPSSLCAERETAEELGLDISFRLPCLSTCTEHGFFDYFTTVRDIPLEKLTLQTEEVQDAKWTTQDEILRMLEKRTFIPMVPSVVPLLFDLKDKIGFYNTVW